MKGNIKYIVWPVVVLIIVIIFREPLAAKLKDGNVSMKFGEYFELTLQQVEQVQAELRAAQEGDLTYEEMQHVMQRATLNLEGVKQQMDLVKSGDVKTVKMKVDNAKAAAVKEAEGFKALEDGDRQQALEHFSKARELYPTYHNVSEISQLLQKQKTDTISKEEIDQIVKDYSWGMPQAVRNQLKQNTN